MTDPGDIDLAACDRDPIHLIGAIQPHGALLAADAATRQVQHASANTQDLLGLAPAAVLGRPLDRLLGAAGWSKLESGNLVPKTPELMRSVSLELGGNTAGPLDCVPHLHDGQIVLEFMPGEPVPAQLWEEEALRQRIIAELVRPETLADLADISADIVRSVIGFDRVMIYRFAPDKHGEVIAESTSRADSFLGQHYPASDIPEPARRHFILNVVRMIADISAPGVPILSQRPASAQPIDLTYSKLRAVPQVHVEYLRNMGVAASCSISLVTNDRLWGLIACHHYSPRRVSPSRLRFLELIGGTISALLQSIENRMLLRRSIDAERIAYDMEMEGRAGAALGTLLPKWAPAILSLLKGNGLVVGHSGEAHEIADVPEPALDYRPMARDLVDGIKTTDQLSTLVEMTDAQREHAAGAAYMELSDDGRDHLVLLRAHYEHSIDWAGKPGKLTRVDANGTTRLSPRGSFEVWREERIGRSRPFDHADREALRILRRALFALNSLERERAAIRAQKEAEAEEARLRVALLEAARQTSLSELASALAHELNQPLTAVTNYVNACRQQLRNLGADLPADIDALMADAVTEAGRSADLLRRLRGFISDGVLLSEETDLEAAIRQGVDLALVARGWHLPRMHYEIAPDLPHVWADPVQLAQVVLNLALNGIAAMQTVPERDLTVRAWAADGRVQVSLEDTGIGVSDGVRELLFEPFQTSSTGGMGIGLSLCRSIIEAHGGAIWHAVPPSGRGAIFAFSVPVMRGRDGA